MQSEPFRGATETPAPSALVRIVGLVMSSLGVAFAMLVGWFVYRLWVLERFDRLFPWVLIAVSAMTATFCLLVGSRLFFMRPNRYGSLLTPRGWRILGSVFYSVTGAMGLAAILSGRSELLVACPFSAAFGLMCFRAGVRLRAATGARPTS